MGHRFIQGTKPVLVSIPADLHALLKKDAEDRACANGGHVSINRATVIRLFESCKQDLSPESRKKVEALIERL